MISSPLDYFGIIPWLLFIVITILTVCSMWNIFLKAGETGWKALFPIYNFYIISKIANARKYFAINLISSIIFAICFCVFAVIGAILTLLAGLASVNGNNGLYTIWIMLLVAIFISFLAIVITRLMIFIKLSASFGQSKVYAFLFLLLPVVGYFIFGISKNINYIGNINNLN